MTISDTIRKAALGPAPEPRFVSTWASHRDDVFNTIYNCLDGYDDFWGAPEEVQRMFLLFCAEDCES